MKRQMSSMIKTIMICMKQKQKRYLLNEEIYENTQGFINWKHLDYNLNSWEKL